MEFTKWLSEGYLQSHTPGSITSMAVNQIKLAKFLYANVQVEEQCLIGDRFFDEDYKDDEIKMPEEKEVWNPDASDYGNISGL